MKGSLAVVLAPAAEAHTARATVEQLNDSSPISRQVVAFGGMSLEDEALLTRYLSSVQAMFERSPFGAVLDRCAELSSLSRPCPKCAASPYPGIQLSPRKLVNPITKELEVYEFGDFCPRCSGTAVVPARLGRKKPAPRTGARRCFKCHGVSGKLDCPNCHGEGYAYTQVAFRSFGAHKGSSGTAPSHENLVLYGVASRRLGEVARVRTMSYRVLVNFYGDVGSRWGRTKFGRLFSVYCFTAAGRSLVRSADKLGPGSPDLTPLERLGVVAEVTSIQPNESRQKLMLEANVQAEVLYQQACDDWNATLPTATERLKDATTHYRRDSEDDED